MVLFCDLFSRPSGFVEYYGFIYIYLFNFYFDIVKL